MNARRVTPSPSVNGSWRETATAAMNSAVA